MILKNQQVKDQNLYHIIKLDMNSKQLNFYAHPNEIDNFLNFINTFGGSISYEPFLSKNFALIENAEILKENECVFKFIIFKKSDLKTNLNTHFIENQDYYLFDSMESNIVQFSFPKIIDEKTLLRSRFYFISSYWKNGEMVKKDKEFIAWASRLFQEFKKQFLKIKEPFHNEYCTIEVKKRLELNKINLKVI